MPFADLIELSDLTPDNGVEIAGPSATAILGFAAAALGDLNGDGFADFLITAPGANSSAGVGYVFFGGPSMAGSLSGLDGTNGFRIAGGSEILGGAAGAGDINGDGVIDLVLRSGLNGKAKVIFGHTGPWSVDFDVGTLNGSNGFTVDTGISGGANVIAATGDVNGDGFDDLLLGNPTSGTGQVRVVFGKASGWGATVDAANLDGTNGFVLQGVTIGEQAGRSLALADLNHDGIDDIVLGTGTLSHAGVSGGAYVVFGKVGGWAATTSLADLNGTNGTLIGSSEVNGQTTAVSLAGDLNGDGIDDIVLGAPGANTSFLVFGHTGPWTATVSLSGLGGADGVRVTGSGRLGQRVSAAGDVNNDGFDDVILGATTSNQHGTATGSAVVLLGRPAWAATQTVSSLTGASSGFVLVGEAARDTAGATVLGLGDVNGDGIGDLLVAASGQYGGNTAGTVYIVYGVQGGISRTGTAAAETLTGASEGDFLAGMAGQDILYGLGGDDFLYGGDNSDQLFGGDGTDDLTGGAGGDILWGGNGDDTLDGGTEGDKLNGEAGTDSLAGGDGNDILSGGDGTDTLFGGDGADTLDGGAGADLLFGGLGNDIYVLGTGDTISEAFGEGYDIVRAAIDVLALAGNVEALQLQGSGDLTGYGNAEANNLQGNSGANALYGLTGVDTINGNDGDDVIVGGAGNDLLRGGIGADRFVVLQESIAGTLETDQVYDFSTAEGDWIDLSAIDAKAGGADDAFTLVGAFTKHAGEMTLTFAGGITTLRLDVNGDGRVDYQMKINGDVTGDSAGWSL